MLTYFTVSEKEEISNILKNYYSFFQPSLNQNTHQDILFVSEGKEKVGFGGGGADEDTQIEKKGGIPRFEDISPPSIAVSTK